ncbi:MAG: Gfo/Idh/MocA family oxidoreductase [Caldilineaceae bacterium]|nr:Gfo/Idh/MocA family oxidoreductase [Caldilineaceae bacterium]
MLRIGLIGCGGMGQAHRSAFGKLQGRARLAAAVDPILPRAQAAADLMGCDTVATDYRQVLNDIDAAIVAVPHHLHHPIGMALLRRGKHLLMEKPLANTEAECLNLIDAAERAGLMLMVAYCMRFHPIVVEMERLIKARTYGELFQLSIWTEQHTQGEPGSWMHCKETLGGGQLFSHGCHYIDILLAWLGQPVCGTHIGTNFGTPWMEGEGTSNVSLKFANGALGYHFGTWGARGTRLKYSFHAHCTEGMLEGQISRGRLLLHQGALEEERGGEKLLLETAVGKHVENELLHFVDCLERGRRPLTDGRRSLRSLRVIWKLYEAEAQGVVADLRSI